MSKMTVVVQAARAGRRRAGRAWPAEPVEVVVGPDGDITDEQLGQLDSDPEIVVSRSPAGSSPAAPGAAPDRGTAAELVAELRERVFDAGSDLSNVAIPDLRGLLIILASRGLSQERDDHFTNRGLPEIGALKEATGLASIPASERDALWRDREAVTGRRAGPAEESE